MSCPSPTPGCSPATPPRRFFAAEIPSYRRAAIWWVISAKKRDAQERQKLIELSAQGRQIPQFLASAVVDD